MQIDVEKRIKALEIKVGWLMKKLREKPRHSKAVLKKQKGPHSTREDQIAAIRFYIRSCSHKQDSEFIPGLLHINPEGRRFIDFNTWIWKVMRVKHVFRDNQNLASLPSLRTRVRLLFGLMDIPIHEYPKRIGIPSIKPMFEVPEYGRAVGEDYLPYAMSTVEGLSVAPPDPDTTTPSS